MTGAARPVLGAPSPPAPPDVRVIDAVVRAALAEDLGAVGDITSEAVVPAGAVVEAVIAAREAGVIAGMPVAARVFAAVNPAIVFEPRCRDGDAVPAGAPLADVRGSARDVLAAERTALNLLGHMSGIATKTARFVEAVAGTDAKILDTRKTTPGLRALEKYAVRAGGGRNHRMGLHDAVLIKDNHVEVAGGVGAAVRGARTRVGRDVLVEVEVDTPDQLREAVAAGPDAILLDNMDVETLREAVRMVGGRVLLEASGGMDEEGARQAAEAGVDFVSVGALTHSAPQLNVALDLAVDGGFGTPPED